MPSAMVCVANCGVVPASAACIAGKARVCTPIRPIEGLMPHAAIAMPASKPPPPIGTQRQSMSGWSSSISSATVP